MPGLDVRKKKINNLYHKQMKQIVIKIAGLTVIALTSTLQVKAEPAATKKTIIQCLGKDLPTYTSTFGEPKITKRKDGLGERVIHTYKTENIDALVVHQLQDNTVPTWILVTFKNQPKTWQDALKSAGISIEGVTARESGGAETVLEGIKSSDGKPWAVSFDSSREALNAPCDLEIMPKNVEFQYNKAFKGNISEAIQGKWDWVDNTPGTDPVELLKDGGGKLGGKPITWKLATDGSVILTNEAGLTATITLASSKKRFFGTDFSGKDIYGIRR